MERIQDPFLRLRDRQVDWKFPWAHLLNGETWALEPGVDFQGDYKQFRRIIYYVARFYFGNVKVRTRWNPHSDRLLVQALQDHVIELDTEVPPHPSRDSNSAT